MNWSKFNILFESNSGFYYLYNSRKNTFYKLSKELYDLLNDLYTKKTTVGLSEKLIIDLVEKKILVDDFEDESYLTQMKYLKRKSAFNSYTLSIVLAPTFACNFKCPYCYENNLNNIFIDENIQDKLIDFINSHELTTKNLHLCWHGGEPLLAYNQIRTILNKIKENSRLPLESHKMVSNGYLFNLEMCHFFRDTNLNYLQITIDGKEQTHNVNRVHKSGKHTYQTIISNIDMIVTEMPECHVGIRVNIHNENKDDYPLIYNELTERWRGKNCKIYPAFVLPQSNGCGVSCLSSKEKALFYIDLYRKFGFENLDFKPSLNLGSCSAIYDKSYIIDPIGNLYKCWADFGFDDRIIGNIEGGINKWDYISEYAINSDKFVDNKCLQCSIFPVCEGGCNRFRIDSKLYGIPYDVCPVDKNGLIGYLEIIYEQLNHSKL